MGNEMARMLWAQCWQVTLLILIVGLLSRWLCRNRPHVTHALWVVVLLKALTPPIWSSPSGLFSWLQTPQASEEIVEPIPAEEPPPAPAAISPTMLDVPEESLAEISEPLPPAIPEAEAWDQVPPIPADLVFAEAAMDVEELQPAFPQPAETESPPSRPIWIPLILAVWITGALGSLLLALARWLVCWREIRRALVVHDPLAQELFETLKTRLRVRRKVRLLISQSRIGPAVVGLVRPTVLIPARVMAGKSASDLEPILAHELIHIRRGDLWVGWLQVLAEAVWWFHPLIRFAGRWLKHEAERCCDEEVIGELGYRPVRYARVLLDVLELKHILKPVPVLPGVKPVEITSKRLERIMLLGQGCRKRTPWWCWLMMLLAAALTLPGAAFVAEAKDKTKRKERRAEQESPSANSSVAQTKTYKVGDAIQKIQTDFGLPDEATARIELAAYLKTVVGPIWQDEAWLFSENEAGTPSLRIKGNTLRVHHTPCVQAEIADQLKLIRVNGYQHIMIEARIMTASRELVEKSVKRWETLPAENPPGDSGERILWAAPDRDFGGKAENGARMLVEKSIPMRMALLDEPEMKELIEACQADARSNLLSCPKVTAFNGQFVTIQSTTQRPFVVGISEDGKPGLRVVSEGISLKLRPVLDERHIRLESEITLSDIRGVEVMNLPGQPGDENPLKVQVPEVATTRINTTVKVPDGGSVLLGGLKTLNEEREPAGTPILNKVPYVSRLFKNPDVGHENPDEQLFVLLKVTHLSREESNAIRPNPPAPALPRDLSDADVRNAEKAARIAILEQQKALEAWRRAKTGESESEVHRAETEFFQAREAAEQAMQKLQFRKQRTGELHHGVGVNSESGLTGRVVLPKKDFDKVEIEPPTDEEVLKALGKDSTAKGASPLHAVERKNIVITKEKLSQSADSPKYYPLVGPAQVHTARFKCTVVFDEIQKSEWPVPFSNSARKKQQLLIDKSRVVRVESLPQPSPKEPAVLPAAHYLKEDVQHFPAGPKFQLPPTGEKPAIQEAVDDFNTLYREKRFAEAEMVAKLALESYPGNETFEMMRWKARFARREAMKNAVAGAMEDPVIEDVHDPLLEKYGFKTWKELSRTRTQQWQTETERTIEKQLTMKVTLNYTRTPLSEVLKELSTNSGLNIVIDNSGLSEEGLTAEHPVTLSVKDVKLSTALEVILEPLRLCYQVQDEVLKINSKARIENTTLEVKTYPVADLVIPIPQRVSLDLREKERPGQTTMAEESNKSAPATSDHRIHPNPIVTDTEGLMQLIQSTVHPDSWDERGGSGAIKFYETTLSLVVRQTPKVHEELRDLLEQLRRLQDVQVCLALRTIEVESLDDKDLAKKLESGKPVSLTPDEAEALKLTLHENNGAKVVNAPKVTLFNGQTVQILFHTDDDAGLSMDLSPVISPDRRFVRLGISPTSQNNSDRPSNVQSLLKDGHSVLLNLTKNNAKTMKLSLITPTIIVPEEEEERLGNATRHSGKTTVNGTNFSRLTPPMIIQEEEELLGTEEK